MKQIPPRDASPSELLGNLMAARRLSADIDFIDTRVVAEQLETEAEHISFEIIGRDLGFQADHLVDGVRFRVSDVDLFRAGIASLLAIIDETVRRGWSETARADRAAGEQ